MAVEMEVAVGRVMVGDGTGVGDGGRGVAHAAKDNKTVTTANILNHILMPFISDSFA